MQDLQGGLVSDRTTSTARHQDNAKSGGIPSSGRCGSPRRAFAIAAALALLLPAASPAAVTVAQKCEGGKNDAAGKYAACMAKAERSLVFGGSLEGYDAAQAKCFAKYFGTWAKLEGGGSCPTMGDISSIQGFLDTCVLSVADALGGGELPAIGGVPATGQTICYTTGGLVTPCAGTGQDGESQKGVARSFTDNGDGTITDNATSLMWEKLSNDGTIHDKDNLYTWANAFASKVATLNSTVFAGHNDWRVPNVMEFQSLVNFAADSPAAYSGFNTGCVAACTVLTCSCTPSSNHWTSSTYQDNPSFAWYGSYYDGATGGGVKTASLGLRAVRAGS
jgi:hypothetical protein